MGFNLNFLGEKYTIKWKKIINPTIKREGAIFMLLQQRFNLIPNLNRYGKIYLDIVRFARIKLNLNSWKELNKESIKSTK